MNEQSYATATDQAALAKIEPSLSDGPALTVPTHTATDWKVSVVSVGGQTFSIDKTTDATTVCRRSARTCTPVGQGGCPASGKW